MNYYQALILGIVEGLTEFLPISSTAHLMLAETLQGINKENDFVTTFDVVIQCGAIASVVVLYWRKFLVEWQVLARVLAAFVPTAILGALFYKRIRGLLEDDVVALWALAIGGVVLIVFELLHGERLDSEDDNAKLPYWKAVCIGLAQSVAMIPGVSRAGATILGGLALGIKRQTIVEFSFLLAAPTMVAASGRKLLDTSLQFSGEQLALLAIGTVVSFVVAMLAIHGFLRFIKNNTFIGFGVYRIVAAAAFWYFVMR
ncbi:MAG: undecaprenyl-diphosphate phosphatase [Planctomycetes bacterium]|nr:undecaprenyl-diphosphate phosphatase [Planctomycetota bacterium]